MNTQPKFKKGDRVRVIDNHSLKGVITDEWEGYGWFMKANWTEQPIRMFAYELEIEPYSPAPDMLAIPDDHVFRVEWRKIDGQIGVVFTDGNRVYNRKWFSATHYLTEADLLKLPFQK